MKITLKEFSRVATEQPVTVHSIDMVGYQATVVMDGAEWRFVCEDGRPLRYQSLMKMREALHPMPVSSLTLHHQSAYDEMVNQPTRQQSNSLELPLSLDLDTGTT